MGKYSVPEDIIDELIFHYSREADHEEAEGYIGKILSRMGIDTDNIDITQLMRDLSITYATYKRAFYEFNVKGGIFHKKYLKYELKLQELTAELMSKHINANNVFDSVFSEPDDLATGD